MNKLEVGLLMLSLAATAMSAVIIEDQQKRLARYESHYKKMTTWADVTSSLIKAHYENGGTLRIPKDLEDKLDAYLIFARNDMS